jgi:hypothetical protein
VGADINGPIASTVRVTDPDVLAILYDPHTGLATDGYLGSGIACCNIDTLPSETPRDASLHFERCLLPYMKGILYANWAGDYDAGLLTLPEEVRPSVLVWNGTLSPWMQANLAVQEGLAQYRAAPYPYRQYR